MCVAMKRTMALLLTVLLMCYGSALADNTTDMLSLQDFSKAITHDPNGALNYWNSSIDHCLWEGITCSHTHLGRVVALNLTGRGFAGNISPSLGNLTFLKAIDLSANSFSGQLPPLNHLHKLQSLLLSNNTLDGVIPDSLTNCSNLRGIDLSRNSLVGEIPHRLDSLSKLSFLRLSYNNLTGTIPLSLSNITQLTKIFLSYNKITGAIPYELGNLPNTLWLFLGGNMLSGEIPPSIFNGSSLEQLGLELNSLGKTLPPNMGDALPNLRWLTLGGNMLEGQIPASLGNASGLQLLVLRENNFSGQVPSSFDKLSELQTLNLQKNHIEATDSKSWGFLFNRSSLQIISLRQNQLHGNIPDFIGNFSTNLLQIYLDGNQLTGAVPPSIGNLHHLISLGLGGNDLSGTIEWIGKLTELQALYMEMNNFTGSIPPSVGNLANLNLLYLANNQFQGVLPPSLGKLSQLSDLDLSFNKFQGVLPPSLGKLSQLSHLDLSFNKFQGNISLLGNLKQLINLNISSNLFTGEIPSTLGQCQNLATLQIYQNFLIGDIPISFGSLVSLTFLNLSHNNLSGTIPAVLGDLHLSKLDLSYNDLQGEVPANGVFKNATIVSLQGNLGLCGGVKDLKIPSCTVITQRAVAWHRLIKVLIPIFGFMSLILLVYLLFLAKKTSRKGNLPEISFGEHFPKVSYQDLAQATADFSESNLVGRGSYGSVYRGKLKDHEMAVAVKVFDLEMRGAERSFLAECEALRRIQHRNLLPIFTACSTIDNSGHVFKALVYEYMPNGSLDSWLHDKGNGKASKLLGLSQRINIAVNLADALDYIHHDCGRPTIHCDLKPSNILLNDDMTALLADFGIARFYRDSCSTSTGATNSVGLRGTIGYIPPEYAGGDQVSTSGDVYSFGIVLLEMMIGKRPTDPMFKDGLDIVNFVDTNFPDQLLCVIEDHLIEECGDFSETRKSESVIYQIFVSLLQVAISCACSSPNERMDMKQVASKMQEIKASYLGWAARK